jgi:hypothetical protein
MGVVCLISQTKDPLWGPVRQWGLGRTDEELPQRTRTDGLAILFANGRYRDLVSGGNPGAVLEAPGECSHVSKGGHVGTWRKICSFSY